MVCSIAAAHEVPSRPALLGTHIAIYAADTAAAEHYYADVVGCERASDPENPQGSRYYINRLQFIEVLPLADRNSPNRLDHLAYQTSDADRLRLYLKSKGVEVPAAVQNAGDGSRWFDVTDPERNRVQFVQPPKHPRSVSAPTLLGHHLMRVGMLVRDRQKEDAFYRTVLDFRPYWYGGLSADKTDFVSQQTPESHDYLEYELVGRPGNTRAGVDLSQRQLGDLNHFSIGVVSIAKAYDLLKATNRLTPPEATTRMARDGKWQLSVFDPDGTRLEYEEFSNVRAPCCSEFTAPNPSPSE